MTIAGSAEEDLFEASYLQSEREVGLQKGQIKAARLIGSVHDNKFGHNTLYVFKFETDLSFDEMKKGWRTFMNTELFAKVISKYGFEMIEQNDDLVHKPGDIISVFKKPKD